MRYFGSWHRKHASRLRTGITVRRSVPSGVSITLLEVRCSGGYRWHAWQVGERSVRSTPGSSGRLE